MIYDAHSTRWDGFTTIKCFLKSPHYHACWESIIIIDEPGEHRMFLFSAALHIGRDLPSCLYVECDWFYLFTERHLVCSFESCDHWIDCDVMNSNLLGLLISACQFQVRSLRPRILVAILRSRYRFQVTQTFRVWLCENSQILAQWHSCKCSLGKWTSGTSTT